MNTLIFGKKLKIPSKEPAFLEILKFELINLILIWIVLWLNKYQKTSFLAKNIPVTRY